MHHGAVALRIPQRIVAPLFLDRLGLRADYLSPLASLLASYVAGSSPSDSLIDAVLEHDAIHDLAAIIARPERRMRCRVGGSHRDAGEFDACTRSSVSSEAVVVVATLHDELFLRWFDNRRAFLDWMLTQCTAPVRPLPVAAWPDTLSAGSLVAWLQAADVHRWLAIQAALGHRPFAGAEIPADIFFGALTTFLATGDMRWLLPAVLLVAPGLDPVGKLATSDFRRLAESDLLHAVNGSGQTPALRFGSAGLQAVREFRLGWHLTAGIESCVLTARGLRIVARAVLLTSPAARRLFEIETTGADPAIHHQVLTGEEPMAHLSRLLFADERSEASVGQPTADRRPACVVCGALNQSATYCRQCGKALVCKACGVERLDARPSCAWCGVVIAPNVA